MVARRRRKSGLHGILPDLGSVQPMDVAAGALVGLVVAAGIKSVVKKNLPTVANAIPSGVLPAGLGISAGAVLYYLQKNMAPQRASGHAVGAAVAGLAIAALDYLKANNPAPTFLDFSDAPVSLNLSDYSGLLVENQAMGGLLVDNQAMGALGVASMGGDDEMGYSDVVALQA